MHGRKPSVADIDIWRAANLVIQNYADPVLHAARRYDELLDAGDQDGCAVWKRILEAIKHLQAEASGGPVH